MKAAAIAVTLFAAGALAIWRMDPGATRASGATGQSPSPDANEEPAPSSISTDAGEVFRKAFWQHPGKDDRILHAERREWSDQSGLRKWQWFIIVDASPTLLKRLRDDNVFGLQHQAAKPAFSNPPDWFRVPDNGVKFMTSPHGGFCLVLDQAGRRIHATDSGEGFRPGAPEVTRDSPLPVTGSPTSHGRLPDSMPPVSKPNSR